ncbi:MAG: hypothetical protein JJ863_17540 [Deltaproteobacteria bacterium]|nr:hypothetical protein [Deltaproteobacteria bacterium]
MSEPHVKPLFNLPKSIHKIDFVERLTTAIGQPKQTAATYVVTPPIHDAFEKALKLVDAGLKQNRSQATFLHGSFGSGKSHFMALLSLMLEANEDVWGIPELHPLRAKFDWVGEKRLLKLHFHMIGKASIEQAIFLRYIEHVREHHPDATVPGLFADEQLFADARQMLDELGDDAFFAPMNEAEGAVSDQQNEWGEFAESGWNRERFEASAESSEPKKREELFSALVKTRFRAYAETQRQFLDLDSGLGIVGRHAKELGYDGIVLFLDELILWLASRASNVEWFHNEAQKMVKLVEAQESHRDIPFISFIARQRDLAEMVGEDYMGLENKLVRDSLTWSEGRYETIELPDNSLPAIAEKRVLKPADEMAKETLDQAFDRMRRGAADPAWKTMLGKLDAADFRRLYPFSPALVEALIALSNSLQRERTAIRLLTEILVEHIEDLSLGGVVGVGDLYDVLAGGDDTADGVMKSRFESAKQMYTYRFLPVLQEQHGTNTPEKCQRLRPDHPARLGCSNCTQTACRTDNRMVKTLIIAALVPEVTPLKDMTAAKLVQLNHGSLRVPIPGTEANLVAQKLRTWASQIGQLHVGSQADPTVRLQLEGVELGPILEQASHVDGPGARQRVLRDLLFEAMGVESIADWGKDHKYKDWRGTDRLGHIRFGNVRKMGPEALRCPEGHDWRLIVDYPFDEPGFGPHHDEEVLEAFKEETGGTWTLVWLPSFFSHSINQMLGELVILDHILETPGTTKGYVSHLSVENQVRAQNDLANLRTQKQSRILQALGQAYGLTQVKEGDLDTALSVDDHLIVLKPGAKVQTSLAANLATALDNYIPELLAARYPRHPRFTKKLTTARQKNLIARFGEIIDSDDKRIAADKSLGDEMRGTLGELGLVRVTETAVHLVQDQMLQELEKKRQQKSAERPEVGELRRWIDENGRMGLQPEALDLVVRCYARWSARTFVSGDQAYTPVAGKPIPDYIVLEKPDLPTHQGWLAAKQLAGTAFGLPNIGNALHADNLKRFESELAKTLKEKVGDCTKLPGLLKQRLGQLDLDTDVARVTTASSADSLCAGLQGKNGKAQVEFLAAFEPETSARAVGASIGSVSQVVALLDDALVFGAFDQLEGRQAELEGATELLEKVASVLRQDELNQAAAERLRGLAEEATRILNPPPPAGRVVYEGSLHRQGKAEVIDHLESALAKVREALDGEGHEVTMTGQIRISVPGKK